MNDNEKILGTIVTANGVANITKPIVMTEPFRRHAVMLVKSLDREFYDKEYKIAKYPPGGGGATPETRRAAYKALMHRAAELAVTHYLRIE